MDKTILNLLFNYKGTLSYREFRAGSIILFMLTATVLGISFLGAYSNLIIGRVGGAEQLASYEIYQRVIWPFIPALVPAQFIIAYSSFILALKRMRSMKKFNGIASGILNFLFFASLISFMLTIIQLVVKDPSHTNYSQILSSPIFLGFLSVLIIIGLVNLTNSMMRQTTEKKFNPDELKEKRLDIISYAIRNGNIMAVMGIISILTIIGIPLSFFTVFDDEILRAFGVLFFVMPIGFYIKYSIYRMRDARIPFTWFIFMVTVYVTIAIGYIVSIAYLPKLLYITTTVFQVATATFVFGQYILLLLPTKEVTVAEQVQIQQKEVLIDLTPVENKEITVVS